jgi:hypothetical protein
MHIRSWHNPDEPVRAERWEEVSCSALNEWRLSATSFSTAVILQSAKTGRTDRRARRSQNDRQGPLA